MPLTPYSIAALAALWVPLTQGDREPLPAESAEQESEDEAVGGQGRDTLLHVVTEEVSLAELFDALAKLRGVAIDFDRGRLSKKVTIRSREGLSVDGLWAAANRMLQAEGQACVQAPGEEGLSVVALESAASLARIEREDLLGAIAGFVKVIVPCRGDAQKVATSAAKAFEKGGLRVEALTETGHLVVAGLLPSVEEALRLVRLLDAAPSALAIEEVPLEHASPLGLAALLEQLAQKRKAVDGTGLAGSAIARPAAGTLMLVAPEEELPTWREMIARFDQPEDLDTRWYVPRRFGLEETARLVESLFADGAGGFALDVTRDALTGSLVITATPSAHAAVEAVFRRLDETDAPTRRVLRSFPVRHRDVEELLEMLSALVDAGAALPAADLASAPASKESTYSEEVQGATAPIEANVPPAPPAIESDDDAPLSLSADPGSSRILAYGEPRLLEEVERLLQTLDVPRPQVLVEALVVTVSERDVRDLGVELRKSGTSGEGLFELASIFGLGAPDTDASAIPTPGGAGFTGVVLDPGSFSAVVRALETRSRGRTLTIPKVLVSNHEPATLDSVLQTPFLSVNATQTVATTSLGGTADAGTQIEVTPHIGEGDRLRLEYSVSVSSFVGSPADPALPPPRQENKLQATASLPDGYAVVVGGLEVESASKDGSRVPWISRVPLLGLLFQDRSESATRSRLFVFLRASILRSQSFEDLRYASERPMREAGVDDGWPELAPRIMR